MSESGRAERACVHCGCTDERACEGGCCWVSEDPPVCSACAEKATMHAETIGGSLVDAARISVMGAMALLPAAAQILLAGEDDKPSVQDCLEQAMEWLTAARQITIEQGAPVTSIHVVHR